MRPQILSAVTYSARCARSLLETFLQKTQDASSNSVLLFALAPSSATPPEVLSDITSTLTQRYPDHVGCISAPLPEQYLGVGLPGGPHSCSLAYALVNGVSFRSSILGRAETQVGRWHAARQRSKGEYGAQVSPEDSHMRLIDELSESGGQINWEDIWGRAANSVAGLSLLQHSKSEALPDGMQDLDPLATDNILYFSDKAPEGLAAVLDGAFPRATKLSLIASSTPFITGRPVTLFHNGSILSSGAVGIAFDSSRTASPVTELSFPPLVALSADLRVTSSEGNLIISLDLGNPTRLLLNAIQKHGLSSSHAWVGKEDEFYIGVIDPPSQQICQLHRIEAGDPSRGSIALDAASAPREGSIVRLYHLPGDPLRDITTYAPDANANAMSLFVAPETSTLSGSAGTAGDRLVLSNGFLAASENGFTLSRGAQGLWKCVVPGARVGLSWNSSQ